MSRAKAFFYVCGGIFILIGAAPVAAGPTPPTNQLYGFITSNRTLTYAYPGPIYDVLGDLVVNPGVTLTVEPGVTLRMAASDVLQGGDYTTLVELDVLGSLMAESTTDSIAFLPASPNSDWGQIKAEPGATVRLRNVSVRNPRVGLMAFGPSTVAVSQSRFSNNGTMNFGSFHGGASALYGNGAAIEMTPTDTLAPIPTTIDGFQIGIYGSVVARNAVLIGCASGTSVGFAYYCTAYACQNVGISAGASVNCIAALCGIGFGGYADYADSWQNGQNFNSTHGQHVASFNPFFTNVSAGDFSLASGSVFKNFSATGSEIGAYGPGPGSPTAASARSWGQLKVTYRK